MTVPNIINIAKVCVYLAIKAIQIGREKDTLLPQKLAYGMLTVEDIYDSDPTDADLTFAANGLYAMCGGYAFEAEGIVAGGSGGIVPSPTNTGYYEPAFIDYTVSGLNNPNTTVTELQNDEWIGLLGLTELTVNNQVFQLNVNFTFNSALGIIEFDVPLYGNTYYPQNNDVITSTGLYKIII